ncbi:hypothetical protein DPEC_G00307430 [Dallia pectoralis]|uniref:Uncharacterized protein n=1 Tax=Dallia pectoralis TaxID=75939 RepID=A0ACC2FEI1_DALPE|nr:hypothetical protein DPEC_G00307430 [Dallia pectoralis]
MAWRGDRGFQTLLTAVGAFAAFSLMTTAIGTDYWLYSRAYVCNATNGSTDDTQTRPRKTPGDLTHSGLWRICCIEGTNEGSCFRINHFPDDNGYDTDNSEYLLRVVRASSVFPIFSNCLLMLGGLCVVVGRIYSNRNNILLSAGILFVAAGLSNIIGIIVYISSNTGDPSDKRNKDKKNAYSYGWSFYFSALSFIVAEAVAVLAVNIYIEKNKEVHCRARREFIRSIRSSSPYSRIVTTSYKKRHRTSHSSIHSSDGSQVSSPATKKVVASGPLEEFTMYTLSCDAGQNGKVSENAYGPEHNSVNFLHVHDCFPNTLEDGVNQRTTPV